MPLKENLTEYLIEPKRPNSPAVLEMRQSFRTLAQLLTRLEQVVLPDSLHRASALQEEFNRFSVRVSLIGQVKAGKTAMTNAILGEQDLLPSDVNPWTSVVTSIHLNAPRSDGKSAVFKFFNRDEWDGMVETGGRIAAMAKSANLETAGTDLRLQIEEMQARTRERLGKNFEMLLGNQHAFSQFHSDLIKRYVCLGEEDKLSEREGRFADLTKTADLYMDHDKYKYPITICDTPGVNDPFLVREAVTLDSLGRSDICVIVLSAHQAFSTVDIALMRILISLKHEQIVLFINRVDELADPDAQIPEIDSYVRSTLASQGMSTSIPIVFGSAAWADAALAGHMDDLPRDSVESLEALLHARDIRDLDNSYEPGTPDSARNKMEDLSGLAELRRVMDEKSALDVGLPFARQLAQRSADLAAQSALVLRRTTSDAPKTGGKFDISMVLNKLDTLLTHVEGEFSTMTQTESEKVLYAMSEAYSSFSSRELKSLHRLLNNRGKLADWTPDTEELRRQTNQIYLEFGQEARKTVLDLSHKSAELITKLYIALLGADGDNLNVGAPAVAQVPTPVCLMRTMSVDLGAGGLSGWLRRTINKDVYLKKFEALVVAETQTTVTEVQRDYVETYALATKKILCDFIRGHRDTLRSMSELNDADARMALRKTLGVSDEVHERISQLDSIVLELEGLYGAQVGQKQAIPA